jgi:hypothetical protein
MEVRHVFLSCFVAFVTHLLIEIEELAHVECRSSLQVSESLVFMTD